MVGFLVLVFMFSVIGVLNEFCVWFIQVVSCLGVLIVLMLVSIVFSGVSFVLLMVVVLRQELQKLVIFCLMVLGFCFCFISLLMMVLVFGLGRCLLVGLMSVWMWFGFSVEGLVSSVVIVEVLLCVLYRCGQLVQVISGLLIISIVLLQLVFCICGCVFLMCSLCSSLQWIVQGCVLLFRWLVLFCVFISFQGMLVDLWFSLISILFVFVRQLFSFSGISRWNRVWLICGFWLWLFEFWCISLCISGFWVWWVCILEWVCLVLSVQVMLMVLFRFLLVIVLMRLQLVLWQLELGGWCSVLVMFFIVLFMWKCFGMVVVWVCRVCQFLVV